MSATPNRRVVLVGAAGLVLGGAAAATAWALRDEPERSGSDFVRPSAAPAKDWRVAMDAEQFVRPVLSGDSLYAYDVKGVAYRLDARTGAVRWRHPTPATTSSAHFGIVIAGDTVVLGGSLDDGPGIVLALDADTGKQRWRHDTAGSPTATLGAGSDVLVAGDRTGRLFGIGLADGAERWRHELVPGAPNFNGITSVTPVGELALAVHEYDGEFYSANVLIALDRTGKVRWSVDASEAGWTPRPTPSADADVPPGQLGLVPWIGDEADGLVHLIRSPGYVNNVGGEDPATSEELIACRVDTGEQVWSLRAHRVDVPLRRGNTLYVRVLTAKGRKGEVRALDAATGAVRWSYRMRVGSSFTRQTRLDADGDVLTVGDGYGVVVLGADDGAERWSASDDDGSWSAGPLVVGDRVVVADSAGTRALLRQWRRADGTPLPARGGFATTHDMLRDEHTLYLLTSYAIHAFALPMT